MEHELETISEHMERIETGLEKTSHELKEVKKTVIKLERLSKENYERISSQEKNYPTITSAIFYCLIGGFIMFAILLILSYIE